MKNCKVPKRTERNEADVNVVVEEIHGALVLVVESGDHETWVINSNASFYTIGQHDILENYVVGNYGKIYLADGEPSNIIDFRLEDREGTSCSEYDQELNFSGVVE